MLGNDKSKRTVLTEHESNVLEIRDEIADKVFDSSRRESPQEQARKYPSALIFMGLFTAWLGYHWMSQFTAFLKSGAMGAGGMVLFVVYPLLASMVLVGLTMTFKGLKALFSS